MKRDQSLFILAIGWFILTVILLILPGSVFPQENWLDRIWADKWVHFFLFGILVFLWCRFFYKRDAKGKLKKIFLGVMISGMIYGVGMEFIQKYFIPNRSFDLGDIVADFIGCFIGFFYNWRKYIKK